MTPNTAIRLIAQRLGNRTDLDAVILLELQGRKEALESDAWLPWFLENATTPSEQITSTKPWFTLPDNFLQEVEEGAVWYLDETTEELVEIHKHALDKVQAGSLTKVGAPCGYALYNGAINFYPKPDKTYQIIINYYGRDSEIASNGPETLWLRNASDLLIADTCIYMSEHVRNPAMQQTFENQRKRAYDKLYMTSEARKHVNRDYVMGEDL